MGYIGKVHKVADVFLRGHRDREVLYAQCRIIPMRSPVGTPYLFYHLGMSLEKEGEGQADCFGDPLAPLLHARTTVGFSVSKDFYSSFRRPLPASTRT